MIRFSISFDNRSKKEIDNLDKDFLQGFTLGFQKAILIAEAGAKKRSPVLTGHLRRSIRSGAKIDIRKASGWVGSDVIYAPIQEEGGIIRPKRYKYLKFQIRGQWRSVKQVYIKGKHYLERGMVENLARIKDVIRNEIVKSMNKGK